MTLVLSNRRMLIILGTTLAMTMSMGTASAGWIWKPAGMVGYPAPGMTGMYRLPGNAGMYRAPGMNGMYRAPGMGGMRSVPGMGGMRGMNSRMGGGFKILEKTWTPPD